MRDGADFELYTTSIDGSLIRKWGKWEFGRTFFGKIRMTLKSPYIETINLD